MWELCMGVGKLLIAHAMVCMVACGGWVSWLGGGRWAVWGCACGCWQVAYCSYGGACWVGGQTYFSISK